jgi:hypothetical protein
LCSKFIKKSEQQILTTVGAEITFSLPKIKKKHIRTKKNPKNNNSVKRMLDRLENG